MDRADKPLHGTRAAARPATAGRQPNGDEGTPGPGVRRDAVLQGRTFDDVSIVSSDGTCGRIDGFALTQDRQDEIAAGTRCRLERHVRSEIMIYYAGHVAESMRAGKLTLRGAEADLAQAAEMATRLYADEATRGAFVLWL